MLKQLIYKLLKRRHFWRYASFSEVGELYTSRTLRMLALNMAAMFVVAYLYQLGYSLSFIAIYLMLYMAVKTLLSLPAGWFVARFGPKHAMLTGNIFYAIAIFLITLVPQHGVLFIALAALLQTASATLYDVGYQVDFSKVKDIKHTGQELGFMNIFDKIATGLSPLIGGLIAFLFGPEVVMIIAAFLFAIAALPLFRTGEPVETHRRLQFQGFPWKTAWRSMRAYTGVGYDDITSGVTWSLFIIIAVIGSTSNNMYAQLGGFASITLIAAFAASYIYGKLVDHKRGGQLLKIATVVNGLVHLSRPFVNTPAGVISTNVANEVATTGYKMAFTKGDFDMADRSGNRVLYVALLQLSHNAGSFIASSVLLICILIFGDLGGLKMSFLTAAIAGLVIMTARFPLYRK